jgi:hypothetical protein
MLMLRVAVPLVPAGSVAVNVTTRAVALGRSLEFVYVTERKIVWYTARLARPLSVRTPVAALYVLVIEVAGVATPSRS